MFAVDRCGTSEQAAASVDDRAAMDALWGVEDLYFHISALSWSPYEPEFAACVLATDDDLLQANAGPNEVAFKAAARLSVSWHESSDTTLIQEAVAASLPPHLTLCDTVTCQCERSRTVRH